MSLKSVDVSSTTRLSLMRMPRKLAHAILTPNAAHQKCTTCPQSPRTRPSGRPLYLDIDPNETLKQPRMVGRGPFTDENVCELVTNFQTSLEQNIVSGATPQDQ